MLDVVEDVDIGPWLAERFEGVEEEGGGEVSVDARASGRRSPTTSASPRRGYR